MSILVQIWGGLLAIFMAVINFTDYGLPALTAIDTELNKFQSIAYVNLESQMLEEKVNAFLDGTDPDPNIPQSISQMAFDPTVYHSFVIQRESEIDPNDQWLQIAAHSTDSSANSYWWRMNDCTYLGIFKTLVPAGGKVVIKGKYARCRQQHFDATTVYNPDHQHGFFIPFQGNVDGIGGNGVDAVEIAPDNGSKNPFVLHARRDHEKRDYTMTYYVPSVYDQAFNAHRFKPGNIQDFHTDFKGPYYQHGRMEGNEYAFGSIQKCGVTPYIAAGIPEPASRHDWGKIWIRYDFPQPGTDWKGGVPLPKAVYYTASGKPYYIKYNMDTVKQYANLKTACPVQDFSYVNQAPWCHTPDTFTPTGQLLMNGGFTMQFSIGQVIQSGSIGTLVKNYGGWANTPPDALAVFKRWAVEQDWSTGTKDHLRGDPYCSLNADTCPTTRTYFVHATNCESGKVLVVTGKMPTFPNDLSNRVEKTQVNSWALSGYGDPTRVWLSGLTPFPGICVTYISDKDVTIDQDRMYVIVFHRPGQKPTNAVVENGVTPVNYNTLDTVNFTWRITKTYPHQWSSELPDEETTPPIKNSRESAFLDLAQMGMNQSSTKIGLYKPKFSYMNVSTFESMGNDVRWNHPAVLECSKDISDPTKDQNSPLRWGL